VISDKSVIQLAFMVHAHILRAKRWVHVSVRIHGLDLSVIFLLPHVPLLVSMVDASAMVMLLHVSVNLDGWEMYVMSDKFVIRHVFMVNAPIFPIWMSLDVFVKTAGQELHVMFLLLSVVLHVSMVDVSVMVILQHVYVSLDGQEQHVIKELLLVNQHVIMVDVLCMVTVHHVFVSLDGLATLVIYEESAR